MLRLARVFALLLLAAGAVPASAQTGAVAQAGGQVTYSLAPGDLLRIDIWRERDLSGEFIVDVDGVVTLPLLGRQNVTGVPMDQLHARLMEQYAVHLRNPSITITPRRRVNIFGEVRTPGLYPLDPTVSLAGAIALAGGATELGDLQRIRILRGGQELRERVGVAETLAAADIRSGDQIIVERRGWFERNSPMLLGTAINVLATIVTTLIILSANGDDGGGSGTDN
ncbi:MAG TPA: polysaccharide biosynthesis/export family protein [Longimicrobium sp.]|nr:polysaccharide biosynthesis/export family protein [Longimicrobium sp.]